MNGAIGDPGRRATKTEFAPMSFLAGRVSESVDAMWWGWNYWAAMHPWLAIFLICCASWWVLFLLTRPTLLGSLCGHGIAGFWSFVWSTSSELAWQFDEWLIQFIPYSSRRLERHAVAAHTQLLRKAAEISNSALTEIRANMSEFDARKVLQLTDSINSLASKLQGLEDPQADQQRIVYQAGTGCACLFSVIFVVTKFGHLLGL